MRDYAKVGPKFWIGETGKKLRGHCDAQIVAMYLMTNPHANMIGLYYLPLMFLAHETGMSMEGARKGLQRAIEADFCGYDEDAEVVWVKEMAVYQIGDQLDPQDKRCKGVQNEYDSIPQNCFLSAFYERYAESFHLTKQRNLTPILPSPSEAPSEPHRSQEQEQEQEHTIATTSQAKSPRPKKGNGHDKPPTPTAETWAAYVAAYHERYGVDPVRNAKVNGQLANLVGQLGQENAPPVAAFYLTLNRSYFVAKKHAVGPLVQNAESLHTEWLTRAGDTERMVV